DKATMEVPAPFDGVVKEVKVKVGDEIAEGTVVALIEAAESGASKTAPAAPAVAPAPAAKAAAPAPVAAPAPAPAAAAAAPTPADAGGPRTPPVPFDAASVMPGKVP